jgi:hypothetical protein
VTTNVWGGAHVCVLVNATSVGNGVWKVDKITVTEDKFKYRNVDYYFMFHLYAHNTRTDQVAVSNGGGYVGGVQCPCSGKISYTFNLGADTGIPVTDAFWTQFSGAISAGVALYDEDLYNSTVDLGDAEADLN